MIKLRIVLFLLAICMLAFIAENTNAQTFPIRIKLHQPVPGQLNASNLWRATLTNTSRNDMKISLEGYAEEQRDGRIVEGQTAVFKISPGDREYKYEDFKNGSVKWSNKKYETVLLRTGNAPAGTYTICMTAKDEEGNIVGMEQCIMQVIGGDVQQEITLLSPDDGDGAGEGDEMGLTFVWLSPNNKGPFSMKIVEILGNQSPDAAMKANHAFFEQMRITGTTFQYPVTAQRFEEEKNYAWQISAGDVKSEVWTIRPRPGQKPSCKDFKVSIVLNNKGDEKRKISPGTREGDTALNKGDEKRKISPGTREGDTALNKGDEKRKISPGTREGDTALNKGDEKRKISPGNRDGDLITGKEDNGSACFYNISITNNYNGSAANGPASFRITTINSNIISAAGVPTGWNQTPASIPPNTNYIVWSKAQGTIQTGSINLGTVTFGNGAADPFYVVYEWIDIKEKVICKDSVQVGVCGDDCKNNLIRNGGFIQANVQGVMPSPGAVQFWTRGYGAPTVDNNPSEGFIEQGFIKLSGNLISGQSVAQVLDPNNKIVTGKKYKLSVAVRFMSSQNSLDYVKIRVIAFNGNIFSAGGIHPPPSTDVAIIGRSSKIRDCNDWSVIEFPVWTANKDFSNIAINAFTNDNSNATVWIDNVTSCEVTQSDCAEIQVDAAGNPILPSGYGNLPQGITCQPEAEGDDYYNGSLQDLYPGYNGTSDIYSQGKIPCSSIGGTLPPEVNNYNCDDSLRAAGINMTCDELQTLLNQPFDPPQSPNEQAPLHLSEINPISPYCALRLMSVLVLLAIDNATSLTRAPVE